MPPSVPLTELLAHASWLHRLARALTADEAEARDLVQDTWLRALARPPRRDGSARSWLGRVLTNLARQRRRTRSIRGEIASPEQQEAGRAPSPDELLERADAHRVLVDEVMRLREPARSVVLMRYFEELGTAEIARLQRVTESSVRSQLTRARAELRARLERRFGSGASGWCALFGGLGTSHAPSTTAPVATSAVGSTPSLFGALIMQNHLKLVAVAIATLVVGAGWSILLVDGDSENVASADVTTSRLEEPVRPEPPAPPTPVAAAVPETATKPAPTRRSVEASAQTPARATPPPTIVEVVLLDEQARPVHGGGVSARDLTLQPLPSNAPGRLRTRVEDPSFEDGADVEQFKWRLAAPGYATTFALANLRLEEVNHLGEIVMQPASVLAGRVVDAGDEPVMGAEVRVVEASVGATMPEFSRLRGVRGDLSTVTDATGYFRFDDVSPGAQRVWAGHTGFAWTPSATLHLAPHEQRVDLELRIEELAPDESISIRVVDPSGNPVPDAELSWSIRTPTMHRTDVTKADAAGRFLMAVTPDTVVDVRASDPEGRYPDGFARAVTPSGTEHAVALGTLRELALSVVDEDGAPVERFALTVRDADGEPGALNRLFERPTLEDRAEGIARFVPPVGAFRIEVVAPQYSTGFLGPIEESTWGELQTITLERLPGLRGIVTSERRPVEGARVELLLAVDDDVHCEFSGFDVRVMPKPVATTVTDSDGAFELALREDGIYYVRAELSELLGRAPAELGPLSVDARVGADVELELGAGGTIEGYVRVRPGESAEGVIVGCSRADARATTVRADRDGFFRFANLMPGRWLVSRHEFEIDPSGGATLLSMVDEPIEFEWNCVVDEGATTEFDLDLRAAEPCVLEGCLQLTGIDMRSWMADFWPANRNVFAGELPSAILESGGTFSVEVSEPEAYRATFRSPLEGPASIAVETRVEIGVGHNNWELRLETGRVELPALDDDESDSSVRWRLVSIGDGYRVVRELEEPDTPRSPVTLEGVPVGAIELQRAVDGAGPGDWTTRSSGRMVAGERLRLQFQ